MASILSKFLNLFGYQLSAVEGISGANPNNPAIWSPINSYELLARTEAGETITVESALSIGAFYAGTRFISQTIGMAPINMYRRIDDKSKEKAPAHPLHHLLHSEPSPYWTPLTWKQQMTMDAICYGNGYSRIKWRGRAVDELIPLDPTKVQVDFKDSGEPVYLFKKNANEKIQISFKDMFHLPGHGNNYCGLPIIVLAKEAIALGLALEQHATRYFTNGAVLGGTIEFPELTRTPDGGISADTYRRLRESFNREYVGVDKHHTWKILEYGAKANQLAATNVESQFLEARRFMIEEIARWLGLRPHTLGALERAIKSNIEEQARELLMFDLLPWFVKWEQIIKRDLIVAPQTYFAEFNIDMLLRGDTRARWEAYKVAIEHGVMSPDEVRGKENLNPREDGMGERYWEPQANYSTGALDGQEAPEESDSDSSTRASAIAEKTIDAILKKEIDAIARYGQRHSSKESNVWEKWLEDWYGKHKVCLVNRLEIEPETAEQYCQANMADILANGYKTAANWMPEKKEWLMMAAIGSNGYEISEDN